MNSARSVIRPHFLDDALNTIKEVKAIIAPTPKSKRYRIANNAVVAFKGFMNGGYSANDVVDRLNLLCQEADASKKFFSTEQKVTLLSALRVIIGDIASWSARTESQAELAAKDSRLVALEKQTHNQFEIINHKDIEIEKLHATVNDMDAKYKKLVQSNQQDIEWAKTAEIRLEELLSVNAALVELNQKQQKTIAELELERNHLLMVQNLQLANDDMVKHEQSEVKYPQQEAVTDMSAPTPEPTAMAITLQLIPKLLPLSIGTASTGLFKSGQVNLALDNTLCENQEQRYQIKQSR